MGIPRYWKKATKDVTDSNGGTKRISAWGWSSASEDEAVRTAQFRLNKVAARLGSLTESANSYPYPRTPLREEIISEIEPGEDNFSVITRNSYGALILNSSHFYIADIDIAPTSTVGWLGKFFGAKPNKTTPACTEEAALAMLDKFIGDNRGWGVRVYRTAAGLRYLATHQPLKASERSIIETLTALGSDPKYIKLCEIQRCFRARLTPKPWRCGCSSAPTRFPFIDEGAKTVFSNWLAQYDVSANSYSSCRFIKSVGLSAIHPKLAELVQFHDQYCRSETSLPLA